MDSPWWGSPGRRLPISSSRARAPYRGSAASSTNGTTARWSCPAPGRFLTAPLPVPEPRQRLRHPTVPDPATVVPNAHVASVVHPVLERRRVDSDDLRLLRAHARPRDPLPEEDSKAVSVLSERRGPPHGGTPRNGGFKEDVLAFVSSPTPCQRRLGAVGSPPRRRQENRLLDVSRGSNQAMATGNPGARPPMVHAPVSGMARPFWAQGVWGTGTRSVAPG